MLPHRARVDRGAMAMKGCSVFPKAQHYWDLTIRLFSVISGHSLGVVLPLCRGAVSVYYSPNRLGNFYQDSLQYFKICVPPLDILCKGHIIETGSVCVSAHLVFMETSLLSQTRFLNPAKALEAFYICMSSSASSLLLLETVEPRYMNLFIWVSTWPSTCISWLMSWDPVGGWYITFF